MNSKPKYVIHIKRKTLDTIEKVIGIAIFLFTFAYASIVFFINI